MSLLNDRQAVESFRDAHEDEFPGLVVIDSLDPVNLTPEGQRIVMVTVRWDTGEVNETGLTIPSTLESIAEHIGSSWKAPAS